MNGINVKRDKVDIYYIILRLMEKIPDITDKDIIEILYILERIFKVPTMCVFAEIDGEIKSERALECIDECKRMDDNNRYTVSVLNRYFLYDAYIEDAVAIQQGKLKKR